MELRIRNLSKTYANGVVALDKVTLNIPTGMFGLLGPERRRQVDADAHPRHAAGMRLRLGVPGRTRRARRKGRGAPPARLPAAGLRRLPESDRLRTARPFRRAQGPVEQGAPARSGRRPAAANQPVRSAPPAPGRLLGRHAPALRHRPGAAGRPAADHRRRADRRPRPAGTGALPQPAVRYRRGQDRAAVDPHRVRRGRPVRQHGHHQQGPRAAVRRAAKADRRRSTARSGSASSPRPKLADFQQQPRGDLDPPADRPHPDPRVRRARPGRRLRAGHRRPRRRVLRHHRRAPRFAASNC